MIIPDANLLLYAYNSSAPLHMAAVRWWEAALSGREQVGLTEPVVFAFLRIATSARVFDRPMDLRIARSHVDSWLRRRVVKVLIPPPDHVRTVLDLLESAGSSGGNLVTDAQIAALARAHHGTVHTADQDFRRFPDLKLHYPLQQTERGR